jgi:hypothetical protein
MRNSFFRKTFHKTSLSFRLLRHNIFGLTLFLSALPATGFADPFYNSSDLTIPWPDTIDKTECTSQRLQNGNIACAQIGQNGQDGAVLITRHQGYQLNRRDKLQAHLQASENALSDIPNVRVMQSRILSDQPLIAMMEILRKDATISDISALSNPPVRQTSLLIPIGNELAQLFIYLPIDTPDAESQYLTLVQTFTSQIKVDQQLDTSTPDNDEISHANSTLALLPRALITGTILSLLIIGLIVLRTRLSRRAKERQQQREEEKAAHLDSFGES